MQLCGSYQVAEWGRTLPQVALLQGALGRAQQAPEQTVEMTGSGQIAQCGMYQVVVHGPQPPQMAPLRGPLGRA